MQCHWPVCLPFLHGYWPAWYMKVRWISKCSTIGLSAFLSYMDIDQLDIWRSFYFLNAVFWLSWAAGQWRVGTTESLPFCWPSYQIWIHTACWWCQATVVHWKQMGDDEILIAQHTEFRKWGMCLWCAALTAGVDGLGVGVAWSSVCSASFSHS